MEPRNGRYRGPRHEEAPLGSVSNCSPGSSPGPCTANNPRPHQLSQGLQPYRPHSARLRERPAAATSRLRRSRGRRPERRDRQQSLKPTRRTHPAGKSNLELAGRWLRWGRVGGRAEHDCIELAVELGEPSVFFLDLLGFAPHSQGFAPQLLGFALHSQGFAPQLLDFFLDLRGFALELFRSQLGGADLPLDVGIVSPVERLQEQAPSRQR